VRIEVNHKERQLAAIRHETPDRIPVDAQAIENLDVIGEHLGISSSKVQEVLGVDGVNIGFGYMGPPRVDPSGQPLTEWGTPRYQDWGTTHVYPLGNAESVAEIERYAWPNPALYNYKGARDTAARFSKDYAVRGPRFSAITDPVFLLLGQEEAMLKMALNPTVLEATIEQISQVTLEASRQYVKACGEHLDIFCVWEDFATQRGLMFSPEHWRHFFKPRYAKLFEIAKNAEKYVWFHSCGDITAILPDLLDIGMDVWETVQLHTLPISPEKLKREYGKNLTFFGGINTQRLPFMTPDEVSKEVTRCIRLLGKGGGYICGPDHHVKPDVSAQNTLALFKTACEFKAPGYTC
jgi:uroporphyrinogen decarboxylase